MDSRSALAALFSRLVMLAVVSASGASWAGAAASPLPRLPKMVWELYLPEEYQACGVMYGLYARLPEAERARLNAGTKISLDVGTLTRDQTRVLAAWFNSARWGCEPPAQKLDAASVARSSMALNCTDNVVEFSLLSPEKKIRKGLTIACAPERAEWVRDGLPLAPHWFHPVNWQGGLRPPEPQLSRNAVRLQEFREFRGHHTELLTR